MEKETQEIYELKLEQLVEGEKTSLDNTQAIFEGKVELTISVGNAKESIKNILSLKNGDVIKLDKSIEEPLDIHVNSRLIASGESIIIDNKLAVRLVKLKSEKEED